MKIDINGVSITLTKEQLAEIAKQTSKKYTLDDLNSIEDAEKILENCNFHTKYRKSQFVRMKDWYEYQLETIIKAANYIDNNYQEWKADFDNKNISKYINYLEKTSSGWVMGYVYDLYYGSFGPVFLYYKERNTAKLIFKRFSTLYNKWMG